MEVKNMLGLSSPVYVLQRKLQAMFGRDPEVAVRDLADTGEGKYICLILIDNQTKAEAVKSLLKDTYEYGSLSVQIHVYGPGEDEIKRSDVMTPGDIIKNAFDNNPIFQGIVSKRMAVFSMDYCIFKKEVIQFWNDDLSDFYGNYSGLAEDIARELFIIPDISYSTSVE